MTDQLVEVKPRPEPDRDRWGRYLIVPANGGTAKAHTRATTFAATIDDRHNLEQWMIRTTALGLVARQDIYARIASTDAEDKRTLNKLCNEAREAARASSGANLGTALHAFTERVDLGLETTIPSPWDLDVAAYRSTLATHGLLVDPALVEGIVVLPELDVAGTFDRIVTWQGERFIADLKTGADLSWSWNAIAIQLALYANAATIYDPITRTHTPMPDVSKATAIVIHLPVASGRCSLYRVDIKAGWEAAQHCLFVRQWRNAREHLATPVAAVEPGPPAPAAEGTGGGSAPPVPIQTERAIKLRANLVERIERIRAEGHIKTLAGQWPTGIPTFKQSEDHGELDLREIERAIVATEAIHEMSFDPVSIPEIVPAERLAALRLAIDGFDRGQKAALDQITTEAAIARRSISLRRTPTMERFVRAVTAVEFVVTFDGEDDVCRAALSLVLGRGVQPEETVGAVIGALNFDQAERVIALCRANRGAEGVMLAFDAEQRPSFVGNVQPYEQKEEA